MLALSALNVKFKKHSRSYFDVLEDKDNDRSTKRCLMPGILILENDNAVAADSLSQQTTTMSHAHDQKMQTILQAINTYLFKKDRMWYCVGELEERQGVWYAPLTTLSKNYVGSLCVQLRAGKSPKVSFKPRPFRDRLHDLFHLS